MAVGHFKTMICLLASFLIIATQVSGQAAQLRIKQPLGKNYTRSAGERIRLQCDFEFIAATATTKTQTNNNSTTTEQQSSAEPEYQFNPNDFTLYWVKNYQELLQSSKKHFTHVIRRNMTTILVLKRLEAFADSGSYMCVAEYQPPNSLNIQPMLNASSETTLIVKDRVKHRLNQNNQRQRQRNRFEDDLDDSDYLSDIASLDEFIDSTRQNDDDRLLGGAGGGGSDDLIDDFPSLSPTIVENFDDQSFCEPYKGDICSSIITANYSIYSTSSQQQFKIEERLKAIIPLLISSKGALSSRCSTFAVPSLCLFAFPLCDNQQKNNRYQQQKAEPKQICRSDCRLLQENICKSEYQNVKTLFMSSQNADSSSADLSSSLLLDCEQLPPSSDDPSVCLPIIAMTQQSTLQQQQQSTQRNNQQNIYSNNEMPIKKQLHPNEGPDSTMSKIKELLFILLPSLAFTILFVVFLVFCCYRSGMPGQGGPAPGQTQQQTKQFPLQQRHQNSQASSIGLGGGGTLGGKMGPSGGGNSTHSSTLNSQSTQNSQEHLQQHQLLNQQNQQQQLQQQQQLPVNFQAQSRFRQSNASIGMTKKGGVAASAAQRNNFLHNGNRASSSKSSVCSSQTGGQGPAVGLQQQQHQHPPHHMLQQQQNNYDNHQPPTQPQFMQQQIIHHPQQQQQMFPNQQQQQQPTHIFQQHQQQLTLQQQQPMIQHQQPMIQVSTQMAQQQQQSDFQGVKQFSPNSIRLLQEIGQGRFGQVYMGEIIGNATSVTKTIVKTLNQQQTTATTITSTSTTKTNNNVVCSTPMIRSSITSTTNNSTSNNNAVAAHFDEQEFYNEMSLYASLRHRNLANLIGIHATNSRLFSDSLKSILLKGKNNHDQDDVDDDDLDCDDSASMLADRQNASSFFPQSMIFEHLTHGDLKQYLIAQRSRIHANNNNNNNKLSAKMSSNSNLSGVSSSIGGVSSINNNNLNKYRRQTADFLHIGQQIAQGMEYLATKNFVLKDLATRNVLMSDNLTIKISIDLISQYNNNHSADYYKFQNMTLPVRWMSPESLLYGRYTQQSDIWSFGVLLWEMFSLGAQPYGGRTNPEAIEMIRDRKLLPLPSFCSFNENETNNENESEESSGLNNCCPQKVYSLMLECWHESPMQRPSFVEIGQRFRTLESYFLFNNSQNNNENQNNQINSYLNLNHLNHHLSNNPVPPPMVPIHQNNHHHQNQITTMIPYSSSTNSHSTGVTSVPDGGSSCSPLPLPPIEQPKSNAYYLNSPSKPERQLNTSLQAFQSSVAQTSLFAAKFQNSPTTPKIINNSSLQNENDEGWKNSNNRVEDLNDAANSLLRLSSQRISNDNNNQNNSLPPPPPPVPQSNFKQQFDL